MLNLRSLVESKLFPMKEAIPAQLGDELVNVLKQFENNREVGGKNALNRLMSTWLIGPNSTAEKVDLNKLKPNLVGKNVDPTNYYILTMDGKPLVTVKNGEVYQSFGHDSKYKDYGSYSMTALSKLADGAWRITPDKEIQNLKDTRQKMRAAMTALYSDDRRANFVYDKTMPYGATEVSVYWNGDHWSDKYGEYSDTQISEFLKDGLYVDGWGRDSAAATDKDIAKAKAAGKDVSYSDTLKVKVPEYIAKKGASQVRALPGEETRKELNAKLRELMINYRDAKVEELRDEYNKIFPELTNAALSGDRDKEDKVQNKLNALRNALSYLKRLANKLPGEQKEYEWSNKTYNLEYKNAKEMMDVYSDIKSDIDHEIEKLKKGSSW